MVRVLIVWEYAEWSILPNGNFREFFLRRERILRFRNGNSRWPWSQGPKAVTFECLWTYKYVLYTTRQCLVGLFFGMHRYVYVYPDISPRPFPKVRFVALSISTTLEFEPLWFRNRAILHHFTVRLRIHTHGFSVDICLSIRLSVSLYVCLSVCQMRELWQNEIIVCKYMNTIR